MISVILLLNKSADTDNENEVLVNVLQLLGDKKILIDNAQSYASITHIFQIIKPTVLLESNNFSKLLAIWFGGVISKVFTYFYTISLSETRQNINPPGLSH